MILSTPLAHCTEPQGEGTIDAEGKALTGCGYNVGYCGDGANDLGALKSEWVHLFVSLMSLKSKMCVVVRCM